MPPADGTAFQRGLQQAEELGTGFSQSSARGDAPLGSN